MSANVQGSGLSKRQVEAEVKTSKVIDKVIKEDEKEQAQVTKLLLLGTACCGKSTLFKQLRHLYGKGYDDKSLRKYTVIVYSNIITAITILLRQCTKQVKKELEEARQQVLDLDHCKDQPSFQENVTLDEDLATKIAELWKSPEVQETYSRRNEFYLSDSVPYFMANIERIGKFAYVPTREDIFNSRIRTTGAAETLFVVEGEEFCLIDVGGQRNERTKWIHHFEKVTAVIFVASLTDYYQFLAEDRTTNRLVEALTLFEKVVHYEWFERKAVILFMNKKDLLKQYLPMHPIDQYFPIYKGGSSYAKAVEWLSTRFQAVIDDKHRLYTHVTCATNTNSIKHVWTDVNQIVIRGALQKSGLL